VYALCRQLANTTKQSAQQIWLDVVAAFYLGGFTFNSEPGSQICHVRFQVLTAASMMFRIVFWDVLPDDGGSTYLWNVGRQLFYMAVHPRRQFWTSVLSWFFWLSWDSCYTKVGHSPFLLISIINNYPSIWSCNWMSNCRLALLPWRVLVVDCINYVKESEVVLVQLHLLPILILCVVILL
jgi:hypothetical protein